MAYLRRINNLTIEDLAEKVGVSRQAAAKWEKGETVPDIINCDKLAEIFGVSVDDLLHYDPTPQEPGIPPKGKYIFGVTKMGERGQIVIPKEARETMNINPGDTFMVLGDDNPETGGIALVPSARFEELAKNILKGLKANSDEEGDL